MRKILICCLLVYLICIDLSFAFDDVDTHPRITKLATESSNVDNTLKSQLGINEGFNTSFKNTVTGKTYSVYDWIWRGSTAEDNPWCRASSHFHNPLKTWGQAGLSGDQGSIASGIDAYCSAAYPEYSKKNSNVVWATSFTAPDSGKAATNNNMNWDAARKFYKDALISSAKTDRETNFANTFQALGQILHLIQDMAVPAHVRNDFQSHLDNANNAGWSLPTNWPKNPFEFYVYNHPSAITNATAVTATRLTDFWDTDQYTGGNPSLTALTSGLAEYTNANFASEYTLLTERYPLDSPYRFPYPSQDDMTVYLQDMPYLDKWGRPVYRAYLGKTKSGESLQHFATGGRLFFKKYIPNEPVVIEDPVPYLGFDDNCHKDYAALLLPRAVGYSAGLLNYFFRGKVFMEKDPQNAGKYLIKNESSEKMDGIFALYYDDVAENRNAVPGASWTLTINPNSTSSPVTFTEPTSPAPKEKGKYILIFNGKLGMEEGAVVGRTIKLVTVEPKYSISIKAIAPPHLLSGYDSIQYSWGYYLGVGNWTLWPEQMLTGIKDSVTLEITVKEATNTAALSKDIKLAIDPNTNGWWGAKNGSGSLTEVFVRTDDDGKKQVVFTKGNERTGFDQYWYQYSRYKLYPEWRGTYVKAVFVEDENISSKILLRYRDPLTLSISYYRGDTLIGDWTWKESLDTVNLPKDDNHFRDAYYPSEVFKETLITFGDGTAMSQGCYVTAWCFMWSPPGTYY